MSAESEEHAALAKTITQNIEKAMEPVNELASDAKDPEHKTLAKGVIALRSADKITCARITDVQKTSERIEAAVSKNNKGSTIKIPRRDPEKKPVEVPSWLVVTCLLIVLTFIGVMAMTGHLADLVNTYKQVKAVRDGTAALAVPRTNETTPKPKTDS
jgi:hypothetical protein